MAKKKVISFEVEGQCGRCGNEWQVPMSLWFPFKKVRIELCDICFYGLALGLKWDLEGVAKVKAEALK